jgi:hypothetical protein
MLEHKGVDSSDPLHVSHPTPHQCLAGMGILNCAVALLGLTYVAGKRLASLAAVGCMR